MATWLTGLSLAELLLWVAAAFVGLTLLSTALGFLLERLLHRRQIWSVPLDPGQYRFELRGNLNFLAVHVLVVVAAIHLGWLRLGDASPALTWVALYFAFQLYYYPMHRALHHRALVRFHRWHHRSRVTTPLSGQSMSVVEALGWTVGYVGLPALFSQLVAPISAEGWVAYLAFNVYGNIVGHANVELMSGLSRRRLASFFAPPFVYHALHHARWTGHYGFASSTLDRLLHTEFSDWRPIHERVAAGRALESLKERV